MKGMNVKAIASSLIARLKTVDKSMVAELLPLLFAGFFGCSILGQYILLDVIHLPFSLMELFFLPALFAYRRQVLVRLRECKRKPTVGDLALWILLVASAVIGVVKTQDFALLFNYRSILYLVAVIYIVKCNGVKFPLIRLAYVGFAAILGEFVYIVIISDSAIVSSLNCTIIGVTLLSFFVCEKYLWVALTLLVSMITAISSGFRIGIIIIAGCVLEGILFSVIRRDCLADSCKKQKRSIVVISSIALIIVFLFAYEPIIKVIARLTGMSEFAVFRTTERLKNLFRLDFEASQDTGRLSIFAYPFQLFWERIVPRGLIGEAIGEYWLYIDVPILYLYDLFGSFYAFGIVVYSLYCWLDKLPCVFQKTNVGISDTESGVYVLAELMIPVLLVLFIVNGSCVVIVFQALITGLVMGLVLDGQYRTGKVAECLSKVGKVLRYSIMGFVKKIARRNHGKR